MSNQGGAQLKVANLKNVDPTMANRILNEVVVGGPEVGWDDIGMLVCFFGISGRVGYMILENWD